MYICSSTHCCYHSTTFLLAAFNSTESVPPEHFILRNKTSNFRFMPSRSSQTVSYCHFSAVPTKLFKLPYPKASVTLLRPKTSPHFHGSFEKVKEKQPIEQHSWWRFPFVYSVKRNCRSAVPKAWIIVNGAARSTMWLHVTDCSQ